MATREFYKPFNYPRAFEYYNEQQTMHWLPEEVPLHTDVSDWNHKLSANEKNLLTQIFRFFTQGDVDVGKAYFDKYVPVFQLPELRMMMGAFANMESVHQHAYSLLLDTVGMPEAEYQAFHSFEEMQAKHNFIDQFKIIQDESDDEFVSYDRLQSIAKSLAVYSGFTEGLQLFSSFAILMNFQRFNKMKGMTTIVEWSIRDESLHVEAMTWMFREFIKENPWVWTDDFKKELYSICREMVDLEDHFIDLAFEQGGIQGLTAEEVKKYIRYIADRRLLQLGLKPNYGVKENPLEWLDWILNGVSHDNFFEKRSTEYAKAGTLKGELWV
jgi:ribonucleoside-diphosphate reductase beta chain